jgi:hypothetical protein
MCRTVSRHEKPLTNDGDKTMNRFRLFALAGLTLVGVTVGSGEAGWPPLHHHPVVATGPVVVSTYAVPVQVVTPEPVYVDRPAAIVVTQPVVVTAPVVVRPVLRPGVFVAPRVIYR